MGKRARRRGGEDHEPAPAVNPASLTRRTFRSRRADAPPAPWGSFPLGELITLAGMIMVIVGFVMGIPSGGPIVTGGLVLIVLSALEVSLREHLAGFRSHTTLLAGAVGIGLLVGAVVATGWPRYVVGLIGLGGFGATWWVLREAFRRRSGVSFRT